MLTVNINQYHVKYHVTVIMFSFSIFTLRLHVAVLPGVTSKLFHAIQIVTRRDHALVRQRRLLLWGGITVGMSYNIIQQDGNHKIMNVLQL